MDPFLSAKLSGFAPETPSGVPAQGSFPEVSQSFPRALPELSQNSPRALPELSQGSPSAPVQILERDTAARLRKKCREI